MHLGLTDRVLVVTGASRGLGRATAAALVAEGARVVVSGRDAERLAATVADLGGDAVAVGVVADNADPAAPGLLADAALARWGRLDGVLVSVGGPPRGTVGEITDEQWTDAFSSVFLGAVRLCRDLAPRLGEGGSIALVLSTSVRVPLPAMALSNGLRPGLAMIAKTLADELGPRGIRVNALLPGRIRTDRLVELDAAAGGDPLERDRSASAAIPLRRSGLPEEFGRVAAFVLSPAASYVTGVVLPVDGGALRSL